MVLELSELRVRSDDWRGVTSTAERKRRQNRLNQRAFRRRAKNRDDDSSRPGSDTPPSSTADPDRAGGSHPGSPSSSGEIVTFRGHLLPPSSQKSAAIWALKLESIQAYSLNTPRPSQLQLLVRLNVLDGLARNAEVLGFPVEGLCADEFVSPFSYRNGAMPDQPLDARLESLSPTVSQRMIVHHPWIDLFPLPQLRDNILHGSSSGILDEDELCSDLLNVEDSNWSETDKPSLILWGQPWDIKGWEASAAFLRKWGWITKGCPELLLATNHWRQSRGERGFVFGVDEHAASPVPPRPSYRPK